MKLTRVLAPTDFSRFSGFALEWAAYLAHVLKAELTILHVIPEEQVQIVEEIIGEGGVVRIPKGLRENVLQERQKEFKTQKDMVLSPEITKSVKIEEIIRIGNPYLEIVKVAKEKGADLIVLGTHGRTGLAHVLIGSVAEKVVHNAPCPVLTIKHPQYQYIAP